MPVASLPNASLPQRVVSVDALRGFVMFTMIFVNDLAGGGKKVPDWMVHFSDRHKGGSGMTFVDLVFPAFLFIVGMSIPIALGNRLKKGEPVWKLLLHVLVRNISLLAIGILMVNGEGGHPNSQLMGVSGTTWTVLMFSAAMLAFCSISPPVWVIPSNGTNRFYSRLTIFLRAIGVGGLLWAALVFRSGKGGRILWADPAPGSWLGSELHLHASWYGILGLIGWAYLVASLAFLFFRENRTALLACVAILLCLFSADRKGFFEGSWLGTKVGIGEDLGSLASISTAGVLLGTILLSPDLRLSPHEFAMRYVATFLMRFPILWRPLAFLFSSFRTRFTTLFIAGFAIAAILLTPQWGISKNNATPAWCLWACAITAALWLLFYLVADVLKLRFISRPLAIAGENVLLAYLLSEMMESLLNLVGLGHWYDNLNEPYLADAIARSAGCAVFILLVTAILNRLGFRLKL